MSDEPRQAKPVLPKTTIARAYTKRFFKPDAHFVEQVIGRADKEANQLRAAAWWSWRRGPLMLDLTQEEGMELMAGKNAEVNQNLRKATGRAVPPAQRADPRQTQLTGLGAACAAKNPEMLAKLVPDELTSDTDVVLFYDTLCQSCPHLFTDDSAFVDQPMSRLIDSAKG